MGDKANETAPGSTSGKSNKFNQQNQHSEERKTGESPRQGEPVVEPTVVEPTEEVVETTETPEEKK